jgi:hypothetical protein
LRVVLLQQAGFMSLCADQRAFLGIGSVHRLDVLVLLTVAGEP